MPRNGKIHSIIATIFQESYPTLPDMDTELAETTKVEDDAVDSAQFRTEFKRGVTSAAPLLAALLAYGMVLGAQATQKGLSFIEVPMMTASNYAGGSEFAAIGLWDSPPPILLIAAV